MKGLLDVDDVVRRAGRLPAVCWLPLLAWVVFFYVITFVKEYMVPQVCANKAQTILLFGAVPLFALFLFVFLPSMLRPRRGALSTVCKHLQGYIDVVDNAVRGLVLKELLDLASQIKKLQEINTLGGRARADRIRRELKELFNAANELSLLPEDVKEKGYDALFG